MRNYVFIKNQDIRYWLEGIIEGNEARVHVYQNRKGTVLTFNRSQDAQAVCLHVQDERNQIAFALAVEPYTEEARKRAKAYERSLTRISIELSNIVIRLRERGR